MADKTTKGKKAYQEFCRAQALAGRMNLADGTWGTGKTDSMQRDYFAGYKLGRGKSKKG